ncbi:SHOCT domain-containing protein [Limnoglobus roseus]|uniref:SHOCT domain-containing protein n=1 Tax=Limnoglobus roseus TaxID=2598579 RepID=A0A5C1AEV9_9BACT|nr:SHOCT domain-containing protein [Limnoglobus roseus]QEL17075.1 SHOCT domain-containing protein [Limnoglobus roseus]
MDPNAQAVPMPPEPLPAPEPPPHPPEAGAIVPQAAPNAPVGLNKAQARQDLIFNMVFLGLAIIGVAVVFSLLKYWTRRQTEDCDTSSLSSFREMYESGELTEEEYEQIRNKMAAKLKGKLGIKPGAATLPKPGVGRTESEPPPESAS